MVKLLAANGADLNARGVIRQWERKVITEPRPKDMNKGGFTALLYAAREGCVECARHLIAAGADPDLEDPERIAPINMALLNLHFEFAAYMIKAGADVEQVGSLRPLAAVHGRGCQHAADERERRDGRAPQRGFDHRARRRPAAARGRRQSEPSAQAPPAVPRRAAGSRRRHHPGPGRDAAAARGAGRRCAVRRAAAQAQGARRSAEQGRRHAADGGGRRRVRRRA